MNNMNNMNNLKVLGLIKISEDSSIFPFEGEDKHNTLFVEDIKNKTQYYIHMVSQVNPFVTYGDVQFYIEPVKEKKLMTHLPKDETFIEGFAINPKTLQYTYVRTNANDDLDFDEYNDLYNEAEQAFNDLPETKYYSNIFYEDDEEKKLKKDIYISNYINNYTGNNAKVYIKNNVFSYLDYGDKDEYAGGFIEIKEKLFIPNTEFPNHEIIETNERLEEVRKKLQRKETIDIINEKKSGNITLNKTLLEQKYLGRDDDSDKLTLKRSGNTHYNKRLMKFLRNRKQKN